MIWAGISWWGRTKLYLVNKKDKAEDYRKTLQRGPFQDARNLLSGSRMPWFFMQDGASIHTAKGTADFFEKHEVPLMKGHPPNSPDLNPIENVWKLLNDRLRRHKIHTKKALFKVAQQEWRRFPWRRSEQILQVCQIG